MPSPLHLTSAAKLLQAGAFFHAGRGSTAGSMIMKGSVTTSARPGLRTFLDGKKDGHTIVFVHGWPDDHSMWDKQVGHLKARYRCITTDLPGFGLSGGDRDIKAEKIGYSVDEVVDRLEATIEEAGNGSPVTIVAHDWGCMYSFLVEKRRPELVKKMVAIDVGGAVEPSLAGLLAIMTYHLWLIVAFRVGGAVGNAMARTFARLVGAPDAARVATATSCYPYYHWWKRRLDKTQKPIKALVPAAPVLFLYGTAGYKSYLMFHADWWAKELNAREGSSSVPMTGSKHWVTRDQPDDLNRRLEAFLDEE